MRKPFLDLDRTLLNSNAFYTAFCQAVVNSYDLPPSYLKDRGLQAARGGFDPLMHLANYGLDPIAVSAAVSQQLSGQNFLYLDVLPFIAKLMELGWDKPSILTVGGAQYQSLKFTMCPELTSEAADSIIISGNKHQWLADRLTQYPSYAEVMVVDDKAESFAGLSHQANLKLYHLIRPDNPSTELSPSQTRRVASLDEVIIELNRFNH